MAAPRDGIALADQRREIDEIDTAIVALLARRMAVVERVIAIKHREGIAPRLTDRVEAVVGHVRHEAAKIGCPPELVETVWRSLIEWTIEFEERRLLSNGE